jgi:hypothetical protein
MKLSWIFFLLLPKIFIFSQNLVKNPGFEDYNVEKPKNQNFDNNYLPLCSDWYAVGTVDLFYDNNINHEQSVAINIFGYHPSKDGKVYAGFCVFKWDGYHEQLTGTLGRPLLKDSVYMISLYIRYAEKASYMLVQKEGIKFSNNLNQYPGTYNVWYNEDIITNQVTADIEFELEDVCDSLWHKKTLTYKAHGGEKYFTFGFFYQKGSDLRDKIIQYMKAWPKGPKQEWKFLRKNEDNAFFPRNPKYDPNKTVINQKFAYYFIDDVSVVEIKE